MDSKNQIQKREIKFRAWDDYKMIHFSLSDLHGSDIGELRADQYCECEDLTSIVSSKTIMQFTGLHDKDGREIYEGDILDFDEREWGGRFKPEVIWMENIIGDWNYCGSLGDVTEWRKVIGNIYENPELLKA